MFEQIEKFLYIVSESRKKLIVLFFMAIVTSVLEAFGVGLIGPFIGVASNPSSIENISFLNWLYGTLNFTSHKQFVIALGLLTTVAFCLKSVALIITNSYTYKVTFNQKKALISRMMHAYLKAPYVFFLNRNTSDIIQNISIETTTFCQDYMMSLLTAVVNLVTIVVLLALLAKTNLFLLAAISAIILIVLGAFSRLSSKFKRWGRARTRADRDMIRAVNHSLGGLKETRVIGCETYFEEQISAYGQSWVNAVTLFRTSNMVFPIIIQTSLIAVIVLFICGSLFFVDQNFEDVTSIMAVFAAASLRLIPAINYLINSISSINNNGHIVDVLYRDIKEIETLRSSDLKRSESANLMTSPMTSAMIPSGSSRLSGVDRHDASRHHVAMRFDQSVEIKNITYRYPSSSEDVIKDISIKLVKGESIALIGKSGAGKTTLVDIILGLLTPQSGDISVDGVSIYSALRSWQDLVGYIPQSIFLMDDTIERNIAFGVPDELINHQRLYEAIKAAQLAEFIDELPDGINTSMGERGVRLSGGQRQRIGIARALYHEREILVLDEATAALDNNTERMVTEAINSLAGKKTLIIIAHRLSTIKQCDRIYELKAGRLNRSGNYREVVENTV